MRKIFRLSLCLLLAASSVYAQENIQPTTTAHVKKVAEQAGQNTRPVKHQPYGSKVINR